MSKSTKNSESKPRRVTAKDVAQAAGVSATAVSFAFNNPTRISEEVRKKIRETADALGYRPDAIARMLAQGRTRSLGVLLPQSISLTMENPFYSQFLIGLGQVCDREGVTPMLIPPLRNSMLEAIPYAAVDGFIVCGLETDRGEVAELQRRGIPYVLVDSESPPDVPSVDITDSLGAKDVTSHLLELGHRNITILTFESGPERETHGYRGTLARRLEGVDEALKEIGLTRASADIEIIELPLAQSAGFETTTKVLQNANPPTAIIAFSDILAIGALDAALQAGLDVPRDISIAGFDDLPQSRWMRPKLTTVRQPVVAKGRVAGDFLVAAIRGEEQPAKEILHTALVVRETTGPVPDLEHSFLSNKGVTQP